MSLNILFFKAYEICYKQLVSKISQSLIRGTACLEVATLLTTRNGAIMENKVTILRLEKSWRTIITQAASFRIFTIERVIFLHKLKVTCKNYF